MAPAPASVPPSGGEWQHEIKFDGFPVQIHLGDGVRMYSRNGHDETRAFRLALAPLAGVANRSAILDAELVACDETGQPCFRTLMRDRGHARTLCLWAFDLLALDDKLLLTRPLRARRAALATVIANVESEHVQFSANFDDGEALLASAHRLGLEGIVSKRRASAYRAAATGDWWKIKTASWRAANKERGRLFKKRNS